MLRPCRATARPSTRRASAGPILAAAWLCLIAPAGLHAQDVTPGAQQSTPILRSVAISLERGNALNIDVRRLVVKWRFIYVDTGMLFTHQQQLEVNTSLL